MPHAIAFPADLGRYSGPLLAIAGEKEASTVRHALTALAAAVPQARLGLAPGMHHIWNVEDSELFNGIPRSWLDGTVDPRLRPVRRDRE